MILYIIDKLNHEHIIHTSYCVDTTCRSAIAAGLDVTLIKDGIIPAEQIIKHHNHHLSMVADVPSTCIQVK